MPQMALFVSSLHHLIIFLALSRFSNSCSGEKGEYGSMTEDHELRVGSPIELTCTLKRDIINIDGERHHANASYLTFVKGDGNYVDAKNIQVVDTLTSKLRIESSTVEDSNVYYCRLNLGNRTLTVCASTVDIGYEPQKSSIDFRCISWDQELECKWQTEPSKLKTDSVLKENAYYGSGHPRPLYKKCPNLTRHNDTWSCKWTRSSIPIYQIRQKVFEFLIETNNSLGKKSDIYHINHYEIVLPSKPQGLTVHSRRETMIELIWLRPLPTEYYPALLYQVLYKPKRKFSKWKANNITENGAEIFHNITGLVPNTVYDIVIRCRSPFAKGEDMWSKNETIQVQTRSDVPYLVPNTTRQAFEVKQFHHGRTIIVRWEHIPEEYWNGEGFHYVVSTHPTRSKREERTISYPNKNVSASYAVFDNLESDSAYYFRIFSANNHGRSRNFSSITVDSAEKLLSVPEDITVISLPQGRYNISWKPPTTNSPSIKNYTLFWCHELRPRPFHCKGSIQWKHITKTNVLLHIPDEKTNLQFAVAANSDKSTSGMEWALCLVSSNDMQYKFQDIFVYNKNSTSWHVMWKLECSALKAIIKEFHIIYCKVAATVSSNCVDEEHVIKIPDSGAEDYYMTGLAPFTLYRLHIRIFTLSDHYVDSDYEYHQTLPGAPDDPPRDVKVLRITNSTIELTWKPPKYPNGVITNYVVMYSSSSNYSYSSSNNRVVLTNFIVPFTNYSIQLKACVGNKCSPPTEPVYALTDIGVPGNMDEPWIEVVNASFAKVSWNPPLSPNGPIDYYILYLLPNKDYNATTIDTSYTETLNITGTVTSALINVECPIVGKGIRYSFQLQSVNKVHNQLLVGEKSKSTSTKMCLLSRDEGLSSEMIVSIIVGSAVGFAILLIVFYMVLRWMKKKYDLLRKIKVRLPTGLDTPNRCAPGTYQDFKKDLLQHCPYPAQIKQRSGAFASDTRKNRHGSGNSQYSNISVDEFLIKKSSRCDMYRRNPSGDSSSGCSSNGGHDSISSSNTNQTHVSTDSGAEIDFSPISVKDNVFSEQNTIQKLFFMPDIEVKDSDCNDELKLPIQNTGSEKDDQSGLGKKPQIIACSSITGNVSSLHSPPCLQPYSKFGFNQIKDVGTNNCSRQWNMLAYVGNLANSEPSVAELDSANSDSCSSTLMPYSKLTFSKSLENIPENCIGYSKCGTIDDSTMQHDFADSVKFPHYTTVGISQNDERTGNLNSIISAKHGYVGIETCLENRNIVSKCNKMLPLNESTNSPMESSNISDPMAYSKFDIKPLGMLSTDFRTDPKTKGYIPIHQANCMLQSVDISNITPRGPYYDSSKELHPSNVSLPPEIMVSAIIEPCVEQCAISRLNSVPIDLCDNFFLYTSNTQDQETIPVSFDCGETDRNQNNTASNEKESAEQYWKHTSLSDINLNIDIRPEESHKMDKLTKSGEQTSTDEQTSVKSHYLKEPEVVVSPGNLNYSTASLPTYRFSSQTDKVDPVNSKNGYVHISPVYYV